MTFAFKCGIGRRDVSGHHRHTQPVKHGFNDLVVVVMNERENIILDLTTCVYRYTPTLRRGKDPVVPGAKQSLGEQLAGSVTG